MLTSFYNRTTYRVLGRDPPTAFVELDKDFDRLPSASPGPVLLHPLVLAAHNLCRRIADVDYFAKAVMDAVHRSDPFVDAELASTLSVAYLSACKSLLDAVALSLRRTRGLQLADRETDFAKARFWGALRQTSVEVFAVWTRFRELSNEIVRWRDAAVHRAAPLLIASSRDASSPWAVLMVARFDDDMTSLVESSGEPAGLTTPDHLHAQWRPEFALMCDLACKEISSAVDRLVTSESRE